MCTAKLLRSPTCNHWWAEILNPCGEGKNFGNCASFEDGRARRPRDYPRYRAEDNTCPKCDRKDDYDGDQIRMVKGLTYGIKTGMGPSKTDFGPDFPSHRAGNLDYGLEPPSVCFCAVM